MKAHVELLGWIHIVLGTLEALPVLLISAFVLLLAPLTGGWHGALVSPVIIVLIGGFLLLHGLPSIIAGIGLLQHKSWARILTLLLSVLALFNFPVGTAIAIYAFWTLTNDETTKLMAATA